jgi:anthranilate synthase component 1
MPTDGHGQFLDIPYDSDLLALHQLDPERYPALVESTADDSALGRYDILFACPQEQLILGADGRLSGDRASGHREFLSAFDAWWEELRPAPGDESTSDDGGSPFTGGWFILLGFELANEIEPHLHLPVDDDQPLAVALRIPVAIVRDRATRTAWIAAETGFETDADIVRTDLARLPVANPATITPIDGDLHEDDPQHFLQAVDRARTYIAAGDIYQANLARRWHGTLRPDATAIDIYRRLRQSNPSPFAGIAALPGVTVVSSSPERLLRSNGRHIETRPIAGTRPRTRAAADDETSRKELRANPKERAEHVMLIDLERNDLGRVCRPGSVEVDEFMVIETYAHVYHIVSNVRGVLREDATPGTIIRSIFPGGSITGCPKVRCMQIISELEDQPRGIYTGAMGYINRDGSADLNILIRTIAVTGNEVTVATGSGIVADSDPEQELEETRAKARGLLLALTGTPEDES